MNCELGSVDKWGTTCKFRIKEKLPKLWDVIMTYRY